MSPSTTIGLHSRTLCTYFVGLLVVSAVACRDSGSDIGGEWVYTASFSTTSGQLTCSFGPMALHLTVLEQPSGAAQLTGTGGQALLTCDGAAGNLAVELDGCLVRQSSFGGFLGVLLNLHCFTGGSSTAVVLEHGSKDPSYERMSGEVSMCLLASPDGSYEPFELLVNFCSLGGIWTALRP